MLLPDDPDTGLTLRAAMDAAEARHHPYPHWLLTDMLPLKVVQAIGALPLAPPAITDSLGRRETHNSCRLFFGAEAQARFPVCRDVVAALQSPVTVAHLARQTGAALSGSYLRVEYCLDTDGFWLEPHTDIGAKFFTMLIYLSDPPDGEDWGTDIYERPDRHIGSAPARTNGGLVFVPSTTSWHGFIRRPITGVRRSLIVNYVTPEWRARHELAFPEQPV
ncbi:2OG-Fe(II) oxygenase family protein [Acidisoma silvae]|uniref:2OG-Fe(II) oxygenase n=1 Tax=Acidisoma silvae TaxID=2802396 RepID=A0A963YS28_9PROT|nr:2OG-Fe(II) oxygenase [Acidisoma silvae]MCB8875871.1 2OG-Fe(II) oxygenase [Acidisoma silvae]